MTDLDKLIAAVEAEDAIVLSNITLQPPPGYLTRDMVRLCRQAFDGSLDAAHRLHRAMLPGWGWDAGHGADEPFYANVYFGRKEHAASGDNPARAWLLAVFQAVRAKDSA